MTEQPPLLDMPHWSEGPLAGFDLETTHPDPLEARIVSSAVVGGIFDQNALWAPDGFEIPAEATSVHGITTEHAIEHGIPRDMALLMLQTTFEMLIRSRIPLVIYNAPYDLTVLKREIPTLDLDELLVLDPLLLDKQFDRYRKGSRKLADTCAHYGVILAADDAHDARADVIASVGLMRALARTHPAIALHTITDLQAQQRRWYANQAASFERYLREKKDQKDAVINRDWPIRALPKLLIDILGDA